MRWSVNDATAPAGQFLDPQFQRGVLGFDFSDPSFQFPNFNFLRISFGPQYRKHV